MARRGSTDAVLVASRALVGVAARSLAETEDTVTLVQYRALVLLAALAPPAQALIWSIETVDHPSNAAVGQESSIVLDSAGHGPVVIN